MSIPDTIEYICHRDIEGMISYDIIPRSPLFGNITLSSLCCLFLSLVFFLRIYTLDFWSNKRRFNHPNISSSHSLE